MQVNPLRSTGSVVDQGASGAVVGRGATPRAPSPPAVAGSVGVPGGAMRGGLRALDTQLNRQVAGAQQTLDFLARAETRLLALKDGLSASLAQGGAAADPALGAELRRFAALWRQRNAATAGSLDAQLRFGEPGEARQAFTLRGLDMKALVSGEPEILTFAVAGGEARTLAVDPELPSRAALNRLDQALMPAGIRARRDARGELQLSARETDWPAIRDGFAVKGGGRRFPAGDFSRAALDAEPEAIRPQTWQADDAARIRQSLQEVVTAAELLRRARASVDAALARVEGRFDAAQQAGEGAWAEGFVDDFAGLGERPGFEVFSAIAPALGAVSRQRVESLLGLR